MRALIVSALVVLPLASACTDAPAPAPPTPAGVLFPGGATFGSGWSPFTETDGERTYRWTTARADVRLPAPRRWSTMRLFLELVVPVDSLPRPPRIRVVLDGRELEAFEARQKDHLKVYLIPARALRQGVEPELVLETSETTWAPPRTLGVALMRASWEPVGGAE